MVKERNLIRIDDAKFIYQTNFSGDPRRDRFGSDARKANITIPDINQALALRDAGFNVKETKPREDEEEGFVPTFFVPINVGYDSPWPPKIYLVSGDNVEPRLLDEESVGDIDDCYVMNVNVILNPYYNPKTGKRSLYVRTMYVEQDISDDPYAARYRR